MDSNAYRHGYFSCAAETLRFLIGVDGQKINDGLKNDLFSHLRNYFFLEKIGTNTQGYMRVLYYRSLSTNFFLIGATI